MVESFPKQFFMMFKLPLILACAIFSAHMACCLLYTSDAADD